MAMIAWEDRDAAGQEALMQHVETGRAAIGWHWTEIVLCAIAIAVAVRDWTSVARTLLSWF